MVAEDESVVLVCGRYEGIDERFLSTYVDEVVSLGDFVLSGGEIPACALMDAVVRQLPGAIKDLSTSDRALRLGFLTRPTIRVRSLARHGGALRAPFRAPRKHQQVDARRKFAIHLANSPGLD